MEFNKIDLLLARLHILTPHARKVLTYKRQQKAAARLARVEDERLTTAAAEACRRGRARATGDRFYGNGNRWVECKRNGNY